MNLRLLASELQEQLLYLPCLGSGREEVHLRDLQSIAAEIDWRLPYAYWGSEAVHAGGVFALLPI